MAYIQKDRVKETTTTNGTGAVTLAGAVAGFQAFSAVMSVADTCYYVIVSATGTDWETGTGTYSSASVLTRTTVLSSSNSGNAVSFAAGTKDVFMGPVANQVNDIAHGGTGATTAADARTNLGVSTGTVMSVSGAGTVSGLTLTGTVTSSGSLTLGGTLSAIPLATGVSGTLPVANGGTGVTTSTGTTNVVLSNSPTLVTPFSNTLSAIPVTVNGPGNSVTIAASAGVAGVTSNPGGSLILQAATQGDSGGDGKVIVKQVAGQTSNLQEWQNSAGTAKLLVTNTGSLYPATSGGADLGTYLQGFNVLRIRTIFVESGSGNSGFACDQNTGVWAGLSGLLGFSNGAPGASTIDTTMYRDAADTLALRRSANAQTFRVYNTYTNASNYERLSATWASNICTIGLENAGTGVARVLNINATTIKTTALTVGTLPAAATAGAGARAFVSDATLTTFATVPIGGGANGVPVYSDGANWYIG